jgi:pimeloyl-ACP methyl ester carboxylesterase
VQLQELDAARHSVTTRSGEVSYLDIGTGPAALFVHGIATNAYLWRHVIGALVARRRCIAIDLPLHGRSPVGDGQDLSLAALVAMTGDLDAAAKLAFGSGYEHLDRVDPAVIRSYLEPWCGTLERARHFERLLTALDAGDLTSVTPLLAELTVPTLVVWGTGDEFFDVSWAYWLRDTIPGTTRVVTVDGARLYFPDERPLDLVPHLEQHWAAAAATRA